MNARVTATLPLICLTLTLAACGSDFDQADSDDSFGGETGETGEAVGDEGGGEGGEGGNDSGSNDDGTGTDLPPDDGMCENQSFELNKLTPNVMLVLDKSGSMNDFTWDDDHDSETPEVTRWHSLYGVVAEVGTQYEDQMNFGVTLFPAADVKWTDVTFDGACAVSDSPDVAVGPGNTAAILGAIPSPDDMNFGGATPATEGILTAAGHLEGLGDELPRAMIFVTDGAANCASAANFVSEYDDSLPLAVADAWQGAGIPTYVVGIDITDDGGSVEVNPRDALNEVALAGGVPREGEVAFYDATTADELDEALAAITTQVGCQLELEFDPSQGEGMFIEADGVEFGQLAGCDDGDGWIQVDPDNNPKQIELCNGACEAVAEAGVAQANLVCE